MKRVSPHESQTDDEAFGGSSVNTPLEEMETDLDALMARVREAANGGTGEDSSAALLTADATGGDSDLVQLIAAQGEWNDRTTKSLASVVDCLQGLQDEWAHMESRLRSEIARVSTLVEEIRTAAAPAVARASGPTSSDGSAAPGLVKRRRVRTRAAKTIKRRGRKP
jgi:hypothetical protein